METLDYPPLDAKKPPVNGGLHILRGRADYATERCLRNAASAPESAQRGQQVRLPTGPAGKNATGSLLAANNLSDLISAATARTNLGLDTAATALLPYFRCIAPPLF